MYVRALALALPFVLGIACKTSSTQSSSDSYAQDPASGLRAEEGTGTDAGNTSVVQNDATSSAAVERNYPSRVATSSSTSSRGTAHDPLMVQDHQPIKAHASDKVLSGTISTAGSHSISVKSDDGRTTTLVIVPETSITKNGEDVQRSMLHEGDQIHASYNEMQGDDIAVVIEITPSDTGSSGSTGASDSTGPSDSKSTGSDTGSTRPGTGQ